MIPGENINEIEKRVLGGDADPARAMFYFYQRYGPPNSHRADDDMVCVYSIPTSDPQVSMVAKIRSSYVLFYLLGPSLPSGASSEQKIAQRLKGNELAEEWFRDQLRPVRVNLHSYPNPYVKCVNILGVCKRGGAGVGRQNAHTKIFANEVKAHPITGFPALTRDKELYSAIDDMMREARGDKETIIAFLRGFKKGAT